jgi:putative sigma-54 modulation protein
MRVNVTFRHMDNTEALRHYAEEKLQRIKKYLYSPADISVVLSVEKHRHIAEVIINAEKMTIKGKEATDDMYSAIDKVVEKVEKQAKKHKDKMVGHSKANFRDSSRGMTPSESDFSGDISSDAPVGIRARTVDGKPMTAEEAAMQLDDSGSEFLLFINVRSKEANVIQPHSDGNYELIVPPGQSLDLPAHIISSPIDGEPMAAEEAAVKLDDSGSGFVAFVNEDSKEINVMYRRKDGDYGLVIPSDERS